MAPPFTPFAADHLTALALTPALAVVCVRLAQRGHERAVRLTLAAILAGALAWYAGAAVIHWQVRWYELLPLELCYAAVLIAIAALITRAPLAAELTWFFGLTAAGLAMVTPVVDRGFPHWHFVTYFVLHGLVVVSALVLPYGCRLGPRPGGGWCAWVALNLMAAVVAVVNAAGDLNYMWLRHKPPQPTLLDYLGPWPVYILVCDLVAAAIFWALGRVRPGQPATRFEAG